MRSLTNYCPFGLTPSPVPRRFYLLADEYQSNFLGCTPPPVDFSSLPPRYLLPINKEVS